MKVKVISVFRDKFSKKLYNVGQIIEIEDEARVEDLVRRGLVEVEEEKPSLFDDFGKDKVVAALKTVGVQASMNMKEETLLSKIQELNEEELEKFKETLGIE